MFNVDHNGELLPFRLEAKYDAVENVLRGMLSARARPETHKKIPDQAARTAWKIEADWLDAQAVKIELGKAEIIEVFLAYVYLPQHEKTFFDQMKEQKFKALLPAKTPKRVSR